MLKPSVGPVVRSIWEKNTCCPSTSQRAVVESNPSAIQFS